MTFVSINKLYFSDYDGGNKFYACMDSLPSLPVPENREIKYIINDTLCGIGIGGDVESGRSIFVSLGAGYRDLWELRFTLTDSSFKESMDALKVNSINEDFLIGWRYGQELVGSVLKDKMCEYVVNFTSYKWIQPENITQTFECGLINLGLKRLYYEDI